MLNTIYSNYINGNLTDAKRQARRYTQTKIREYLIEYCGHTLEEAVDIAAKLKGEK